MMRLCLVQKVAGIHCPTHLRAGHAKRGAVERILTRLVQDGEKGYL
jgi:hypothetical protein